MSCISRHFMEKVPLHVIWHCPKTIIQFLRLGDAEEQTVTIDLLHAASYGIDQVMATTLQRLPFLLVLDGMAMNFSITLPQNWPVSDCGSDHIWQYGDV